jgi:hypothetical protein
MKRTLFRFFVAAVMIGGILPMTGLAQATDAAVMTISIDVNIPNGIGFETAFAAES